MSSVLTLLFAPSFLLLIQYFEFKTIVLIYILLSLLSLIYAYLKKKKKEDFVIVGIYLLLLSTAYFANSFETVKFIPVLSAMTFFTIFTHASIHKHELIFKFTTRFYKKELSDGEVAFLKNGDKFWAIAIFIYAVFLIVLVFYGNDTLWALFSSVGWYVYFVLALVAQIIYGKAYAIKLHTK